MDNNTSEDFILTLVRSLQSLCKGYVTFFNQIQVTGHLYLSVDTEETIEYVVNEKMCKAHNGIVDTISNSFHAQRIQTSHVSPAEPVNVKYESIDCNDIIRTQAFLTVNKTSIKPLGNQPKNISSSSHIKTQNIELSDKCSNKNKEQPHCQENNYISIDLNDPDETGLLIDGSDPEDAISKQKSDMNSCIQGEMKDHRPKFDTRICEDERDPVEYFSSKHLEKSKIL